MTVSRLLGLRTSVESTRILRTCWEDNVMQHSIHIYTYIYIYVSICIYIYVYVYVCMFIYI